MATIEKDVEKVIEENILFDFYGKLLTEKQEEIFSLYYQENYSLSEIADITGITRQGVHEQIKKARVTLEDLESKLRLVDKFRNEKKVVENIEVIINIIETEKENIEEIIEKLQKTKEIMNNILKY